MNDLAIAARRAKTTLSADDYTALKPIVQAGTPAADAVAALVKTRAEAAPADPAAAFAARFGLPSDAERTFPPNKSGLPSKAPRADAKAQATASKTISVDKLRQNVANAEADFSKGETERRDGNEIIASLDRSMAARKELYAVEDAAKPTASKNQYADIPVAAKPVVAAEKPSGTYTIARFNQRGEPEYASGSDTHGIDWTRTSKDAKAYTPQEVYDIVDKHHSSSNDFRVYETGNPMKQSDIMGIKGYAGQNELDEGIYSTEKSWKNGVPSKNQYADIPAELVKPAAKTALSGEPKTYRGTFYYRTREDAQNVLDNLKDNGFPNARVVEYGRGYAVQGEKSGQYVGPEWPKNK
jgi:hypothetical protein